MEDRFEKRAEAEQSEYNRASKNESEDFEFDSPEELKLYIDALCANIEDKKLRKETKKALLFKLRNEYGAIV